MEQVHLEVFCFVKKNFINKISDYSDLYSFGYLVEKSSNNRQTLFKRF